MASIKIIGITMGGPTSIGPEVTAKTLSDPSVYERYKPLVVGDIPMMEEALKMTGPSDKLKIYTIRDVSEAMFEYDAINVCHMGMVDMDKLQRGRVSAMTGDAAFQYVKKIVGLAMDHKIDITVTNTLNEEAINLVGHHYSGHTEIYADYTRTRKYTMVLAHENLRVVHMSAHVSLREAYGRVKKDRILEVIRIAHQACRRLGIFQPKIGVAGLNPHSGKNGIFGRGEIEEITPTIQVTRDENIQADGLVPPDTVLSKARGGWRDIVMAICHDQGHIPLKVMGFAYNREEQKQDTMAGASITLGPPIIHASMDHGTVFDQAGTGLASKLNLTSAMDYAIRVAETKEMEQIQRKRKGKNNGIRKIAGTNTRRDDVLE